jgi:hypothetical protein
VDWNAVERLVQRHGVAAIAYKVLTQHAGDIVPEKCLAVLKSLNGHTRRQALFQSAELVRLLAKFNQQGIEAVPLKGVYLAHQLYGDSGIRNSVDLDILVRPEQVESAEQILDAEGYVCEYSGLSLTIRQKRHLRTHIHHYDFSHRESGLHVELHWELFCWSERQTASLWENLNQQLWHGQEINTLETEHLLLVLCDHGAHHEWQNLKWLGDIAVLIASQDKIHWDSLLKTARRLDLTIILAHSALLIQWIYGIPLPEALRSLVLNDALAVRLGIRAINVMQMSGKEISETGKKARGIRLAWQLKKLRPSMTYFAAFKPTLISQYDWELIKLPPSLFWLYLPLRPFLWFYRRYIRAHV